MTLNDVKAAFPKIVFVMLSYIFLGLSSGFALNSAGFHPLAILLMSLTFFTGSGQFLTASMVAQQTNPWIILFMNLILALRMSLQTSSLSQYIQGESTAFQALFGHTTADEAFGVNTYEFENNPEWTPQKALATNLLAYGTWSVFNVLGALLGSSIDLPLTLVNYVLTAMFISMMVDQLDTSSKRIAALVAILVTVAFQVLLNNSISIVLGAISGATVGYFVKERGGVDYGSNQ